eukprot:504988-Alexandrium_andersonii.AAC.1
MPLQGRHLSDELSPEGIASRAVLLDVIPEGAQSHGLHLDRKSTIPRKLALQPVRSFLPEGIDLPAPEGKAISNIVGLPLLLRD